MSQRVKVGEPFDDHPSIFELIISDHIEAVHAKDFGINERSIDPEDYFITSGDAVEKAKVLEQDLWKLAGELRSKSSISKNKKLKQYEKAIYKAAGQARKLLNALIIAKGDYCFLETDRDDHTIIAVPKNPRR